MAEAWRSWLKPKSELTGSRTKENDSRFRLIEVKFDHSLHLISACPLE